MLMSYEARLICTVEVNHNDGTVAIGTKVIRGGNDELDSVRPVELSLPAWRRLFDAYEAEVLAKVAPSSTRCRCCGGL